MTIAWFFMTTHIGWVGIKQILPRCHVSAEG